MKRLSLLLFSFIVLAEVVNAQTAQPPKLKCRTIMWTTIQAAPMLCNGCPGGENLQPVRDFEARRWERRKFKYLALAKLRNQGPKAIKSIDLDFIFTDIDTKEEFLRYRLHSDRQIKPGAEKDVSQRVRDGKVEGSNYSPTQPSHAILSRTTSAWPVNAPIVNTGRIRPADLLSLEIVRVEYADGSVWQKP